MFYRSYLEVEFHGVSSRTYVKIRPEVTLQNSYILTTIARIYVIINFPLFVNPASTVTLEFVKVYFVYICCMTRQNKKMQGRATEITIYVKCSRSKLKGRELIRFCGRIKRTKYALVLTAPSSLINDHLWSFR